MTALPIAMPSSCWKYLSWKYVVLRQTSNIFIMHSGCKADCSIIMEFIADDLQGFIDWHISEQADIKTN
jgi:hypothetical protein